MYFSPQEQCRIIDWSLNHAANFWQYTCNREWMQFYIHFSHTLLLCNAMQSGKINRQIIMKENTRMKLNYNLKNYGKKKNIYNKIRVFFLLMGAMNALSCQQLPSAMFFAPKEPIQTNVRASFSRWKVEAIWHCQVEIWRQGWMGQHVSAIPLLKVVF